MDFDTHFELVTKHPPLDFQRVLAEKVLARRSVILRAPTGAGKTWATIMPFLHALHHQAPIADRLIYTLPLRSLASALHQQVNKALSELGDTITPSKLQMGGQSEDPFFRSKLTFTTIDQLLSTYLTIPVSLSDRVANIPAGGLIGSYLVFDEVHLLDPERSFGTTIEMLGRLKGLAQFVMMSATLSKSSMNSLAERLDADVVVLSDAEIRKLPSQKSKRRSWALRPEPISAQAIRDVHAGGRTIVVVNSVKRAQELASGLYKDSGNHQPETLLIHSRFFPEDRERVESKLADCFGPKASRTNVILVATQVVEAGLDLSADHLLTESAPMNALIQRAGRVARYRDRNIGQVSVFDAPNRYPYEKDSFELTRTILQEQLTSTPTIIDAAQEQTWVEAVHAAEEALVLRRYQPIAGRRSQIDEAMKHGDRALLRELVRDIDSVNIIISSDPGKLNFSGKDASNRLIGWPRLLGVPFTSLSSLKQLIESPGELPWVARIAEESDQESPKLEFSWTPVKSIGELRQGWLIALHPGAARYDPKLGLVLGQAGPETPPSYKDAPAVLKYQYRAETWVDHSGRVRAQCRELLLEHREGVRRLADLLHAEAEFIEWSADILCALHDLGKLANSWHEKAWAWTKHRGGLSIECPIGTFLAHTDFDPAADWQSFKQFKFPPHAAEGAFAAANVIVDQLTTRAPHLDWLDVAMISVVARHHGPRTKNLTEFTLHPAAVVAVETLGFTLASATLQGPSRNEVNRFCNELLAVDANSAQGIPEWAAYTFLVRILRLADQAATAAASR